MTRLDEAKLGAWIEHFDRDALRVEVLDSYDVDSDADEFARWRAGATEPTLDVVEPWRRWIRDRASSGRTVRSLRILHKPPGDYIRFEFGLICPGNIAAGMEMRVLDLRERPELTDLVSHESWQLDCERIALMVYDDAGRFRFAEALAGLQAEPYIESNDHAWRISEPLVDWWTRHPQFHRPERSGRASA